MRAEPKAGYHFVSWSDGETSEERTDTGITGNISVTAEFAINVMRKVSGGGQTGYAGTELGEAFVVAVEDHHGNGIEGVEVIWTAPSGGDVLPEVTLTDAQGLASAIGVLPSQPGSGIFTAQSLTWELEEIEDSPVSFEVTGEYGEVYSVEIETESTGIAGEEMPVTLRFFDEHGNQIEEEVEFCIRAEGTEGGEPVIEAVVMEDPEELDGMICGRTDGTGVAVLTVMITKAGALEVEVETEEGGVSGAATIEILPGPADHLRMTVLEEEVYACEEAVVEIRVVDAYDNPVEEGAGVEVEISVSGTSGNAWIVDAELEEAEWEGTEKVSGRMPVSGEAMITVILDDAGELEISWESEELEGDPEDHVPAVVRFVVGPVDGVVSEVRAEGTQVYAYSGRIEIKVMPKDACGLIIEEAEVEVESSYGNLSPVEYLGNGEYRTEFSSMDCPEEPAQINAYINGVMLADELSIEVICAQVDPGAEVRVEAGQEEMMACATGEVYAEVKVIPVDMEGGGLPPGQEVMVMGDEPWIVRGGVEEVTDEESGITEYTLLVGSNRCGEYELELRVGGVSLDSRPVISFTCPGVGEVIFHAEPDRVEADGESASLVEIKVSDECGNPGFGREMRLVVTGEAGAVLSAERVITVDEEGGEKDGVAEVEIRSDTAGKAGISATIEGEEYRSEEDLIEFTRRERETEVGDPITDDDDDERPTFVGTGEPGTEIIIEVDGEEVGRVEVDEDGNWEWTPEEPLPEGEVEVTVRTEGRDDAQTINVTIPGKDDDDRPGEGGLSCNCNSGKGSGGGMWILLSGLLLLLWRRRKGS